MADAGDRRNVINKLINLIGGPRQKNKESPHKSFGPVYNILKEISAGDVVYLSQQSWKCIENCDFKNSLEYCQAALDYIWEELNTGYWKDVNICWRQAYTISSFFKVLCQLGADESIEDVFRTCDMGLLMGAPVLDNILVKTMTILQENDFVLQTQVASSTQFNKGCIDSNLEKEGKTRVSIKRKLSSQSTHVVLNKENNDIEKLYCQEMDVMHPPHKDNTTKSGCCGFSGEAEKLPFNSGNSTKVERISNPSMQSFYTNFMMTSTPVIIEKAMNHWPAMSTRQWSVEYIRRKAGHRTVPVEIGERYTSEDWTQKLLTINEFIDDYIISKDDKGYLAQHQLFDQIPELKDDICIPDYCCLGEENNDVMINAWFGPYGTVSPLHHDPYHNLFAQVIGRKYIRIYDPKFSDNLYPHESHLLCNTSQVDIDEPDLAKYPLFQDAPFMDCIVNQGELLYIPRKFWHFVKSLSLSFSVSFWW